MNILILEDEKLASEKLERTLLELEPNANIVARLQTVATAVEWLRTHPHPDLIITDIRLLDGLCFEIFAQVKVEKPVIFTTAYDQYAIKAFEVNSIDYLLKPVQQEKLKASLGKLRNLTPQPAATEPQLTARFKHYQASASMPGDGFDLAELDGHVAIIGVAVELVRADALVMVPLDITCEFFAVSFHRPVQRLSEFLFQL